MQAIGRALRAALQDLLTPRMLGLALWPVFGAAVVWGLIFWLGWSHWLALLQNLLGGDPGGWLAAHAGAWLSTALAWLIAAPLLLILVLLTALLVTSILAVPVMLRAIAARDFPRLQRRRGGSLAGSLANALFATVVYLLLLIITLPLWLIVPFGFLIFPALLNGWLNARLFRYDVLAEHASRDEYRSLIRRHGHELLLLGVVLASAQSVPILNLLAPLLAVYSALAFVHYLLARLAELRAEAADDTEVVA
ncbi:MAG: EI24 domain-containing protein [Gammaproteobacteria bacterium]|nr:EI24 domain-containing protein [Gammaproteobacteria bacterium]